MIDRSKVIVINRAGNQITLDEWQKIYGLPLNSTAISKHFDLKEARFQEDIKLYGKVVINELLFRVLDQFREDVGRPLNLNALNRNQDKQNQLTAEGFRTASFSPHIVREDRTGTWGGLAADIDTSTHDQTNKEVLILQASAHKLGIGIRVGYRQYQTPSKAAPGGMTFIHCDVCPEYFATGKPWSNRFHPKAWEMFGLTW